MNMSIPPQLMQWVERQVEQGGYGTASEFVRHLIRQAKARSFQEGVDEKLLEALDEGSAKPMTRKDWNDIRREGRRRLAREARRRKAS
jgi:antitoxin ParD1/3/4